MPRGRAWLTLLALALSTSLTGKENYTLSGSQTSRINYTLSQRLVPAPGINLLIISTVLPASFTSPTYNQEISNLNLQFHPPPDARDEKLDARGNKVVTATWRQPATAIVATVSLTAANWVKLGTINTSAPFPPDPHTGSEAVYLKPTKQVAADNPLIAAKAKELTRGVTTEFDAVQRILSWVVDHVDYVLTPPSYDALYSFNTGKGNCQNYSHLAAALLRAVGIPVRIVNGVTLNRSYDAATGGGRLTLGMAQGRHSWIDVYFPDLGWVPFDPQQSQLFTSNRYVRIEVGLDNEETTQDGLVRWTVARGAKAQPEFEETINAEFPEDKTMITAKRQSYGPKNLLLSPEVKATFVPYVAAPAPPPPPPKPAPADPAKATYTKPFVFGNLEFPEGVNFAFTREVATGAGGAQELRKNFLVETAEYVTRSAQYAQMFVLDRPLSLEKVALALQKFGGEGFLWVEILKDHNSKPGENIATSPLLAMTDLSNRPGYYWQSFDFTQKNVKLAPGRYWIALGFSGTPVVNWFYSYGKPVGPSDGTRYKTILDEDWSNSLSFEFNYRVEGKTTP
ncbi:MAG: hypothetical protein ONB48_11515 [candidate division KSB1 bacterium]|nr:hypothetical protein [candidate division KSB1 bacterium]MDZ7275418.1 hypothetical protein [candidate division KSB1 bacterium]MDZ7286270.1 hypothetical protein [candidate division KSB1 bacterium]MDZ7296496.1 hypothetical protein [candidate division KSB1 bacterium]MDZ7305546.1 hypothetical protein [candidate division KSB1 bacterium]